MEKKLGNVEFVVGRATTPEEAAALMKQAGDDAPVLAINLCIGGLLRVSAPILESGRPLAVFSAPASGHDWMYPFRWRQEGKPVTMFTSSDYGELERAARLLRVIPLDAPQSRARVSAAAGHAARLLARGDQDAPGHRRGRRAPGAFRRDARGRGSGQGRSRGRAWIATPSRSWSPTAKTC